MSPDEIRLLNMRRSDPAHAITLLDDQSLDSERHYTTLWGGSSYILCKSRWHLSVLQLTQGKPGFNTLDQSSSAESGFPTPQRLLGYKVHL